ncbi:MAG: pseudouridine synthase [Planctomycetaceae bacterium]|nr:pseudouridine synthase [Planctomycetaceae bacterium]
MVHSSPPVTAPPRLQKVLAAAGLGSRRQCEMLILEGRVEVDRQVVTELGTRVDATDQQVRVDGVVIKLPRHKYFLLHKPAGTVSTARDPWARTRVIDLVDDPDRLFTVGRLDKSSSGLILVTNDGDLANRLCHPRYGVHKTYRVTVSGRPTSETLTQLRRGVHLAEGVARVDRVVIKSTKGRFSTLEMVLSEGRNREIRRVLARVGHKVTELKRIGLGPLRLGDIPVGAYRELSRDEVRKLRRVTEGGKSSPRKRVSQQNRQPRKGGVRNKSRKSAGTEQRGTSAKTRGTVLGGTPTASDSASIRRRPRKKTPKRQRG